jgi:hypothetical protein
MEVRYQLRHSPAAPPTARVSDPLVKLVESIPALGGDSKSGGLRRGAAHRSPGHHVAACEQNILLVAISGRRRAGNGGAAPGGTGDVRNFGRRLDGGSQRGPDSDGGRGLDRADGCATCRSRPTTSIT